MWEGREKEVRILAETDTFFTIVFRSDTGLTKP
jgi:hypothetical protein